MAEYNEVISSLPFFGNIQFYSNLVQKNVIIDLHEHFEKQTLRNRCIICGSQGRLNLSIPVHRPSGKKVAVKSIKVSYHEDWRHDHERAVLSAYGSSPFFIHYWDSLKDIWKQEFELLVEWNLHIHKVISTLLKVELPLNFSSEYITSTPGIDLRGQMKKSDYSNARYIQVFEEKIGFQNNLSILDLLLCLGPQSIDYLKSQNL